MHAVAELETHMPARVEADTSKFILSPMPGAIVSINVAEGDHVVEGQEVAVIEAMKMQNVRKSDIACSCCMTCGRMKQLTTVPSLCARMCCSFPHFEHGAGASG